MNYPMYGYQQYPSFQNSGYQNNYQGSYNQQSGDERIWVQGEGAAQAYLVAPNGFVRLWDSTCPVYYEKRADHTGKPYMEVYEYKRRSQEETPQIQAHTDYGDRLEALEKRIALLEKGAEENE